MVGINDSKIILIIGGASGIGQALAYALLDLPSKPTVIVGDKRKDRLDDMVGERLETVHVDVNVGPVELKQFVDDVTAKYSEVGTKLKWMQFHSS
jgi:short-subunit dehydrogenase involved in D-alanine esterification of teichoic acids